MDKPIKQIVQELDDEFEGVAEIYNDTIESEPLDVCSLAGCYGFFDTVNIFIDTLEDGNCTEILIFSKETRNEKLFKGISLNEAVAKAHNYFITQGNEL